MDDGSGAWSWRRHALSRRGLVRWAGASGGSAALTAMFARRGRAAQATPGPAVDTPPETPPWTREQGVPLSHYGQPSPFESNVERVFTDLTPTRLSSWSFSPLQDLHGTITPNGLFFERHHAGVPQIDPAAHRLLLHGLVERPLVFTVDDLKRFPAVSVIHFLECSGNSLTEYKEALIGPTAAVTHGLVSCGEWTGVRLRTLLEEAGVDPGATWLLAEGADAAVMSRSIPMAKAMDDALIVYAQNGEALRPEQGYPIRLLLPGYEGNMNIKWLRRLEAGHHPWETREETSKYTDLLPDGTARQFTFVMEAKSVITRPSGGQALPEPGFWEISGLAWSGRGRITRVDVSTDGGQTWQEAALDDPVRPVSLTRFRLPWTWDGQPGILQSRAVDETGYVQPTIEQLVAARGLNSVYHMNAIQSWSLAADGRVSNVYL